MSNHQHPSNIHKGLVNPYTSCVKISPPKKCGSCSTSHADENTDKTSDHPPTTITFQSNLQSTTNESSINEEAINIDKAWDEYEKSVAERSTAVFFFRKRVHPFFYRSKSCTCEKAKSDERKRKY